MEVRRDEGLANRIGPEPCTVIRDRHGARPRVISDGLRNEDR